jgi:hypothetical protein
MHQIPLSALKPGTILRVTSNRVPVVKHWGVVDWFQDENGQPRMWHSQKGDSLRCTPFAAFSSGQPLCEVVWVPDSLELQNSIIWRLRSKEGLRWNLAEANCEQVVRWALEGKSRSEQLEFGALAILIGLAVGLVWARAK